MPDDPPPDEDGGGGVLQMPLSQYPPCPDPSVQGVPGDVPAQLLTCAENEKDPRRSTDWIATTASSKSRNAPPTMRLASRESVMERSIGEVLAPSKARDGAARSIGLALGPLLWNDSVPASRTPPQCVTEAGAPRAARCLMESPERSRATAPRVSRSVHASPATDAWSRSIRSRTLARSWR